jgi:nucleotide-binding universal stress UspA family protein
MSFQYFLPLLTYPDASPRGGLLRAIDFAATLGGSVKAVAHVVRLPPIVNAFGPVLIDYRELAASAETASRGRAAALSEQATTAAARFGLPIGIEELEAAPELLAEEIVVPARTADYSLLAADPQSPAHRAVAEALLFGSGGPVVLFPANDAPSHLQSVLIAWDGSRAAARAVRDAMPVLTRAREVTIATATGDKPIAAAGIAALLGTLGAHGIRATHQDIALAGKPVGEALQHKAVAQDAGLLVMGAYGHNRIREFVLGGATRDILAGLRLPTLMSH